MKRTDRLLAILIALQQKPQTAQGLAERFDVSKRTIFRDMQSLAEIGIPYYSLSGPRGGFHLMEGFSLPPLQLTTEESLTLLFALRALTKLTDTPFNQARWTVLDKISSLLPQKELSKLESILSSVEMEVPRRNYKTPNLAAIIECTAEEQWIKVFYRSKNHQRLLIIKPQRVYTAQGFWYCEAFSETHGEVRVFRIDRIDSLEQMASIPSKSLQREAETEKNKSLKQERIRIRALLTYRGMLQAEQDPDIGEQVFARGEHEWEVDFECPLSEWHWAVNFFFALGLEAEVLEPSSLREEIKQLAQQLYQRYEG